MLFVGDLSSEDVNQLANLAIRSDAILEFGVGGSTQILAQSKPRSCKLLSIDTEPAWIEKTEQVLGGLNLKSDVLFMTYADWCSDKAQAEARYDFIFNDGKSNLRTIFGVQSFALLKAGGIMAFHDTRVLTHIDDVLELTRQYFEEVESIEFNKGGSNITLVKKRHRLKYVNWRKSEGLPEWRVGLGEPEDVAGHFEAERSAAVQAWPIPCTFDEVLRRFWERLERVLMEGLDKIGAGQSGSVGISVEGLGSRDSLKVTICGDNGACTMEVGQRFPKTADETYFVSLSVPEGYQDLFARLRTCTRIKPLVLAGFRVRRAVVR